MSANDLCDHIVDIVQFNAVCGHMVYDARYSFIC